MAWIDRSIALSRIHGLNAVPHAFMCLSNQGWPGWQVVDFENQGEVEAWRSINDGVMGGRCGSLNSPVFPVRLGYRPLCADWAKCAREYHSQSSACRAASTKCFTEDALRLTSDLD